MVIPPIPDEYKRILEKDVVFYQALNADNKIQFENRLMHFLSTTRITGVKTVVEAEDKVFIAASAIIPIFGFADWEYNNLNEVLLYPDFERNILNGPLLTILNHLLSGARIVP